MIQAGGGEIEQILGVDIATVWPRRGRVGDERRPAALGIGPTNADATGFLPSLVGTPDERARTSEALAAFNG